MQRDSLSAFSLALAASLLCVASSTGCGSNSKSSTLKAPQTLQYKVSLVGSSPTSNYGSVSVDTGGTVTVTLTNATASTSYDLQFCPAPGQSYACFAIGTVMADASGNASPTFTFPKSGAWAGDFNLDVGTNFVFQTGITFGVPQQFLAALVPGSTANGSGAFLNFVPTSQDPLTSGTVQFVSGSYQFDMKGASPSTTYLAGECPTFFGSSCYELVSATGTAAFTTDSSGNVTYLALQDGTAGDIFQADAPGTRAGFVSGFKVP